MCSAPETVPNVMPLAAAEIKKLLGISQAHLRQSVPLLHTIPGIYSMDESSRKRRMYIVAVKQVFNAFTFPRTSASVAATVPANRAHAILRYMAGTTLPYVNIESGEVQRGLCCPGCQIIIEGGTTPNPTEVLARRDRVYSKTGFLDHFVHCPEAQKLWKRSKEGKVAVKLPVSIIRGVFFSERDVVMSFSKRKYSDLMECHQSMAVLSMEICSKDDSEYRLLFDGKVKYITISPYTYDRSTLSAPLQSLPALPRAEEWNTAFISRDPSTSKLETRLSNRKLVGVHEIRGLPDVGQSQATFRKCFRGHCFWEPGLQYFDIFEPASHCNSQDRPI
ncbi:hypothetical protein A7D00_2910 [Trichophyton violaceum]|uniref:Uncharacterized protein n=1 Tax=Trichophyton violaceum TaxID=34388 RepID=A0A178FNS7_TRIVO|nr:hypothetical protein A7D00_2910 [Trichophyton violaceum]